MNYFQRVIEDSKTTRISRLNKLAIGSLLISFALVPLVMFIETALIAPVDFSGVFRSQIIRLVATGLSIPFLVLALVSSLKGIRHGWGHRILHTLTLVGGLIGIFYLIGFILIFIYTIQTIPPLSS